MKERLNEVRSAFGGILKSTKKIFHRHKINVKNLFQEKEFTIKNVLQWKKPIIISSIIGVFVVSAFFIYQSSFSYEVTFNGQKLGFTNEINMIEDVLVQVQNNIEKEYGKDAYFKNEISFEKARVSKGKIMDQSEIQEVISQKIEIVKPAAIILVDGQEELTLDSVQDAQEILEEVKSPFLKENNQEKEKNEKENVEVLEVSFAQEVKIVSKDVPVDEILTKAQAMDIIQETTEKVQTYQVAQGDSAWNISRAFDMGIRTLEQANPGKNLEKLQPGEEINLVVPKAFLDVVTREKQIKIQEVNYKIEEKKDSSMYIGQKKVKEKGKKGKKEVTMEVTLVNGIVTEKDILHEKVLEEPKTELMLVGTKARPSSNISRRPAPTYKGEIGAAIVKTAKGYLGIPYARGGSTPSQGFDCSGFTRYVYGQYGISLPRTSGGQASVGGYVSRSNLRPGDLVIFRGHVGIYVGGNSFIHAPRPGKTVRISSLNTMRLICGRRVY